MENRLAKILSIAVFAVTLVVVVYLSLSLKNGSDKTVSNITVKGNLHLTEANYLEYAYLDNNKEYSHLTAGIIKDRLYKHPYVESVDVNIDQEGNALVSIKEKEFSMLMFHKGKSAIVTGEFEPLPIMPGTRTLNYPIVSNPVLKDTIKYFSDLSSSGELQLVGKLIYSLELLDKDLYKNVSEIDLQNGKGIEVFFNQFSYPVKLGRIQPIRKMIYFSRFWENRLKNYKDSPILRYVDLSFDNHIYLGMNEERS